MTFPLGRSVLVMIFVALVAGTAVAIRSTPTRTDLLIWTFAEAHASTFRGPGPNGGPSLIQQFTTRTGHSVEAKLINGRALDVRMISLFNSNQSGPAVPDLVEVEISSVGKFFRPPVDRVGFLPLNDRIERDNVRGQLVEARLAPWSKNGVIFGLPHDVHPVSLTYRKDLWDEAGIDVEAIQTWKEFRAASEQFMAYWRGKASRRFAIALSTTGSDGVIQMLLQRGVNVVDDQNRVQLADPRVADTIAFYATMVAGKNRVGDDLTPGGVNWVIDLARGDVASMLTADWSITYIKQYAPDLHGKLAMRPLPRFDPTDAPTATWGGTMIGIPRNAKDPELSWQLLKHLYLTRQGIAARREHTDILPPTKEMWNDPIYDRPDEFFRGQKIGRLYCDLAAVVPKRYVTPFTTLGNFQLSLTIGRAISYVQSSGEAGLHEACVEWLKEGQTALEGRIAFGKFED